jgi:hypothetical protein
MGQITSPVLLAALQGASARVLPPMTLSSFDVPGSPTRTLSNGNRTVTNTSGGNGGGTAYGFPVIKGKRYWEVFVTLNNGILAGVGNEDAENTQSALDCFSSVNMLCYSNFDGTVKRNNVLLATASTYTTNDSVRFAMDNDAKLLWVGKITSGVASTWNGSGTANPATGVGGIDISGMYINDYGGSYMHPLIEPRNNLGAATSAFTASQLVGTIPTGFLALDQ